MNEPLSSSPSPLRGVRGDAQRKLELLISVLLRTGVVASIAIVLLGTVISFVHHPEYFTQHPPLEHLTTPGAAFPHTISAVVDGVGNLHGQAFVAVGLILLIATPVLRVA